MDIPLKTVRLLTQVVHSIQIKRQYFVYKSVRAVICFRFFLW